MQTQYRAIRMLAIVEKLCETQLFFEGCFA
jgi:hypothetical protein